MKKILIFSNHPAYTYNLRKEVIDRFIEKKYEVTLVVPYGKEVEYFKDIGVKLIDIKLIERSINPFTDLKLLYQNIKILKKEAPDLVITFATKQNIYGGMASRITKTPYIPMITGLGTTIENPGILQKITSMLYRTGIRGAKTLFVQNDSIVEKLKYFNMVHSPIRMTPGSGVNLEHHHFVDYPEKNEDIKFLYIGRIMRDKGIYELLEAIQNIKKKYPKVSFTVIGHANLEEDKEKIQSADDKGLINYLENQTDVRPFIHEAHAIILPSYHEGMSNVLLESAAAGRPLLASKVPGCQETFDEGVSGIGFASKNVSDLTKAIEEFIQLPYDKKKEMGQAGRRKIEGEFDRKIVAEMYIEEIED